MSPAEFLVELERRNIRLKAEGGQLRFFAKPGAMTTELKAQIASQKAALLAYLESQADATAPDTIFASPIRSVARTGSVPLSFAQERLWFLDQLEGPSATYNLYDASRLSGPLDPAALEQALNETVRRHEALRTTFSQPPGAEGPVQNIHPATSVPLEKVDVSGAPGGQHWEKALAAANEVAQKPLDLMRGPLLRARLIRLAPDDHLFVLVVHHIVYDKWSADLVRRELATIYTDLRSGRRAPLPQPSLQYADFCVWERSPEIEKRIQQDLVFWRKYMQGVPAALELPTDFPRPSRRSYRGGQVRTIFPAPVVQRLRDLARGERASLFHAVLAAWKILLQRYSSLDDIVVGTSVSNRGQAELESVVGFIVNMIPVRTWLDGNTTVREVIRRVQQSSLDVLAHGNAPFERMVRDLMPPRSLDVTPLFQVALSFVSAPPLSQSFHDLTLSPVALTQGASKFDLTLWLTDRPDGLGAALEYASDLFSRERAERILAHLGRLLEGMADRPDSPAGLLPMLTPAELTELVEVRNRTQRDYPRDRCLHELFEEQVRLRPDAPAVVFRQQSLTYRELDQQASVLADLLQARGVGPDVLVGLCVERSLEMVIGILGILKAGGAYLPIDPAYPADRTAFVLEDSKAPVLVTQRSLLSRLPETSAKQILVDDLPRQAASPTEPRLSAVRPDHLAYVLYTSGSTGKPKGVQIPHRAVVNFLNSMRREPGLVPDDVLLAVTTLSFDIAGLEIHLPLTTGAQVVIAPWEVAADGAALLQEIERHRVTLLQATPATWRLLLAAGWKGTSKLKALCGGEALPADLAAELIPRCAELWNMYGPTETTIWSTCSRVTDARNIHIGRPIDNTEVYILDRQQQPLPVGVAGELLIGGDGLARGYLNRPELTADRFVPHPFKQGAKLYRTGDLARFRTDGNIDCLNRLDFQVKIRGFRIELGEIETLLSTHPGIRQNVVVAREDTPGDKRLVAYLVPRSAPAPTAAELREHLRGKLPEYMVPAVFVSLDTLPLTPNGKIDRKALPAPQAGPTAVVREVTAARTATEKVVAELFQNLIGVPVNSIDDSFFDLGGHSLLATKLMAAIERKFGRRVPLAQLFTSPTVRDLAAHLDHEPASEAQWDSLVPIQPHAGKPALFLVHGAGGNVLLYREVAQALAPDVSVYGFQSQGLDKRARPLARVEDMATRYLQELIKFQPSGPYHLGGYCMGGSVAYEMARRLRERGETVGLVAMLDTYNLSTTKRASERGNRFSFFRQKIGFHLGNLAQLNAKDLMGYLGEKMRMAEEAGKDQIATRVRGVMNAISGAAEEPGAEVMIQEINHEAAWNFVPQASDAVITVFRPRKNYDFMPDPKLGWGPLARQGLEVVEMPVNPHAMLIDPHATQLAAEIRRRIAAVLTEAR